jgi:hypothetical protein
VLSAMGQNCSSSINGGRSMQARIMDNTAAIRCDATLVCAIQLILLHSAPLPFYQSSPQSSQRTPTAWNAQKGIYHLQLCLKLIGSSFISLLSFLYAFSSL